MIIIYSILGVLALIILLILVIAAFVKPDYDIKRSIVIAMPQTPVFDYIKYLKNQDNYSKWATMDPAMKKTYEGTDGTVGFKSAWESQNKNVGKGEQEIVAITENERVDYKIHFIKPFDGLADSALSIGAAGPGSTELIWSLKSKMKYPMNVMLLFLNMDKMLGADLDIGLNNLKAILEKN